MNYSLLSATDTPLIILEFGGISFRLGIQELQNLK